MAKQLPTRISEQRAQTVEAVISAMENKGLRWLQEWQAGALAHNAISENAYRGINRLHLTFAAHVRGYDDPRWCTFRQAQTQGWKVKKGARSYAVEKWKSYRVERQDDDGNDTSYTGLACVGYYSVFNLCEVEGAPAYDSHLPALTPNSVTAIADGLIASSRCPVYETQEGRAYYSPARDDIHMPDRRLFVGDNAYRAQNFVRTLAHEMTHSTMAVTHRDTSDYAFEELIAELGSMFVCADLHVPAVYDEGDPHFEQHAAYLKSWLSHFTDKPDTLFSAAARADLAAAYICERYHLMND